MSRFLNNIAVIEIVQVKYLIVVELVKQQVEHEIRFLV